MNRKCSVLLLLAAFCLQFAAIPVVCSNGKPSEPQTGNQTVSDFSKAESLLKTAQNLAGTNPAGSNKYAIEALSLVNEKDNPKLYYLIISTITDNYFALQDNTKALEFSLKKLSSSEKINDTDEQILSYIDISVLYKKTGEYDKALASYKKCLEICEKSGDKVNKSIVINNIGSLYLDLAEYNSALDYLSKALKMKEELGDKQSVASTLNNIGTAYLRSRSFEIALEYYQKSYLIFTELNDKEGIAKCLNNIGSVYQETTEFTKAYDYIKKSLKIREEINDYSGLANCYLNIGANYDYVNNYTEAEKYYTKSYELFEKVNEYYGITYALIDAGNINMKLKNYDRARDLISKGLIYASGKGLKELTAMGYYYFSVLNNTMGDFAAGDRYFQKYTRLSDTLRNQLLQDKIAQMQSMFNTESKTRENKLLKNKNLEQQHKLEANERMFMYFVSSGVFVAIVLAFVVGQYNRKKKHAKLLVSENSRLNKSIAELSEMNQKLKYNSDFLTNLNKTKDKFFSLIAYDLKSPFTSLMMSVETLRLFLDRFDKDELDKTLDQMKGTIESSNEMVDNLVEWSRTQTNSINFHREVINLKHVFRDMYEIVRSHALQKNINIELDLDCDLLVDADRVMVYNILRNLLINAVKFSFPESKVVVSAKPANEFIEVTVTDFGVGMTESEVENLFRLDTKFKTLGTSGESGSGLGLILAYEFVSMNGGELMVDSIPGKGSTFTFTLPAHDKQQYLYN